jgi:tripartite ATP-independent transporter DctM subunit
MVTVKLYTLHPNYPELRVVHGRFEPRAIVSSLREVWPALLAPVIIVGGILSGVFTATEAGVVACLYAFIVGYFFYRKIRLASLPDIFVEAAITTTMVSAVIAVSGAMGWLLAYMEFNDMAVRWVTSAAQNTVLVLLVFAVVMIVLGTFVDSLAILLVFAPVAVELAKRYGIDPIQMGLVMVICNQIGAVSPPTAPLLFVTTNIAQTTLDDTNRHVWTFFTAECLVLLLVIFIPALSTSIPRYFLG